MDNKSITNKHLKTAVTVYLEPGIDELSITSSRSKPTNRPNFLMIGNGTMNKQGIGSIDFLEELVDSTKAEQFLLLAIKNGMNYDNGYKPVVKVIGASKYEQNMIAEGYKSLYARNLVRRTKKAHYIINPNAFIPLNYEEALDTWNSIGN